MSDNRVKDFFYPGNAVHGEPDYGLADTVVHLNDELIDTTCHRIRIMGLPGLILEASESTGQHSFTATGLEASNQEIFPIYPFQKYDKMSIIEMLRELRNYRDHGNSINSAATGIDFGKDHIKNEEEAKIDFLETDYHE